MAYKKEKDKRSSAEHIHSFLTGAVTSTITVFCK